MTDNETEEDTTGNPDATTDGGVTAERTTLIQGLPSWVTGAIPILLLIGLLGLFMVTSPLANIQNQGGEPLPDVTVTQHTLPDDETIVLHVTNNGPREVTISQVLVEDAYWNFEVEGAGGDRTLGSRESARIEIPYHWNEGWDLGTAIVLSNGATIHHDIIAPHQSPGFNMNILWTLALVGVFVGVIPITLGMLWFPFIRQMSDRVLHAILLFAAGVLAFLAFDAGFEAFELSERVPGAYEGKLLVVVGIVGTLLLVQSISSWRDGKTEASRAGSGLWIGYLVALSIGLHNLAEGLAIGSSFALGRVSLGTFLVIGFMLHNVTEGPAIVAPMARGKRPRLRHFVALGLLAGTPVILGGWIGGLFYSPTIGAFFLALGVGAIIQVNWEISSMVRTQGGRLASALNLFAVLVGFGIMYVTDIFVAL
jgi:ZIP family zinc transporter